VGAFYCFYVHCNIKTKQWSTNYIPALDNSLLVACRSQFLGTGVTGSPIILRIAGWGGIFCGGTAIYVSIAEVLNEVYGKVVLPIGLSNP